MWIHWQHVTWCGDFLLTKAGPGFPECPSPCGSGLGLATGKICVWFWRWQRSNSHYSHKVNVGRQVQLPMWLLICQLPRWSGAAAGPPLPHHLLISFHFVWPGPAVCVAWWQRLPASSCKSPTWLRVEEGIGRQVGVCPHGFQFALAPSHSTSSFSSQLQALLTCRPFWPPWTQSNTLLKTPPAFAIVEGPVPVINIIHSGSAIPAASNWCTWFHGKSELQVWRLDSNPGFTTA